MSTTTKMASSTIQEIESVKGCGHTRRLIIETYDNRGDASTTNVAIRWGACPHDTESHLQWCAKVYITIEWHYSSAALPSVELWGTDGHRITAAHPLNASAGSITTDTCIYELLYSSLIWWSTKVPLYCIESASFGYIATQLGIDARLLHRLMPSHRRGAKGIYIAADKHTAVHPTDLNAALDMLSPMAVLPRIDITNDAFCIGDSLAQECIYYVSNCVHAAFDAYVSMSATDHYLRLPGVLRTVPYDTRHGPLPTTVVSKEVALLTDDTRIVMHDGYVASQVPPFYTTVPVDISARDSWRVAFAPTANALNVLEQSMAPRAKPLCIATVMITARVWGANADGTAIVTYHGRAWKRDNDHRRSIDLIQVVGEYCLPLNPLQKMESAVVAAQIGNTGLCTPRCILNDGVWGPHGKHILNAVGCLSVPHSTITTHDWHQVYVPVKREITFYASELQSVHPFGSIAHGMWSYWTTLGPGIAARKCFLEHREWALDYCNHLFGGLAADGSRRGEAVAVRQWITPVIELAMRNWHSLPPLAQDTGTPFAFASTSLTQHATHSPIAKAWSRLLLSAPAPMQHALAVVHAAAAGSPHAIKYERALYHSAVTSIGNGALWWSRVSIHTLTAVAAIAATTTAAHIPPPPPPTPTPASTAGTASAGALLRYVPDMVSTHARKCCHLCTTLNFYRPTVQALHQWQLWPNTEVTADKGDARLLVVIMSLSGQRTATHVSPPIVPRGKTVPIEMIIDLSSWPSSGDAIATISFQLISPVLNRAGGGGCMPLGHAFVCTNDSKRPLNAIPKKIPLETCVGLGGHTESFVTWGTLTDTTLVMALLEEEEGDTAVPQHTSDHAQLALARSRTNMLHCAHDALSHVIGSDTTVRVSPSNYVTPRAIEQYTSLNSQNNTWASNGRFGEPICERKLGISASHSGYAAEQADSVVQCVDASGRVTITHLPRKMAWSMLTRSVLTTPPPLVYMEQLLVDAAYFHSTDPSSLLDPEHPMWPWVIVSAATALALSTPYHTDVEPHDFMQGPGAEYRGTPHDHGISPSIIGGGDCEDIAMSAVTWARHLEQVVAANPMSTTSPLACIASIKCTQERVPCLAHCMVKTSRCSDHLEVHMTAVFTPRAWLTAMIAGGVAQDTRCPLLPFLVEGTMPTCPILNIGEISAQEHECSPDIPILLRDPLRASCHETLIAPSLGIAPEKQGVIALFTSLLFKDEQYTKVRELILRNPDGHEFMVTAGALAVGACRASPPVDLSDDVIQLIEGRAEATELSASTCWCAPLAPAITTLEPMLDALQPILATPAWPPPLIEEGVVEAPYRIQMYPLSTLTLDKVGQLIETVHLIRAEHWCESVSAYLWQITPMHGVGAAVVLWIWAHKDKVRAIAPEVDVRIVTTV
jgi:hypothetical protein